MKKIKLLLFIFGVFFFVGANNVLALTNAERKDIMLKQLDDYKFDFKYVDMTDNYKLIKENGFELSYINIPNWFLSGLVRSELDNVISLENTDAIDLFCYQKGEEYTDYTEEGEITKVRENDGYGISIYLGYEGEGTDNVVVSTTINGSFTKVEGDSETKKEAFSLAKKIIDNVYVADVDILNHYVNYKSK